MGIGDGADEMVVVRGFATYMRSPEHHASHGRVPTGPDAPLLAWISRYEVIAR